ncbi:gamma-glutamylcyclotransferase [Cupriavidus sp. 30B13]|uniref:gamma-glutamylcyclotransferase n=1 Tax=Cupriavidus sp. 30B13 TaxID=3384241 RepID=UPI003B8EDDE9
MFTRETINSGAYLGSFDLPKDVVWTQGQIDASLAETMRARPAGGEVWVFAYGSLMWNPLLNFDRREIATLHGWRRSFCLRMIAGRGSPEVPGRMLALEAGGSTHGVALRLAAGTLEDELRVLWIREMVTGSYLPTWAPLTLADGTETAAIAFVANTARPQYERDSSVATVASIIAAASGSFGSNADYVLALECALSECALADEYIEALAAALRRRAPSAAR